MNGSARTISIDKSFISKLGFGFHAFNDSVRDIVHAIIPEPENLVHCAKKMEEMQKAGDSSVVLGYMPDCDGDRGNIVYWDSKKKKPVFSKRKRFLLYLFCLSLPLPPFVTRHLQRSNRKTLYWHCGKRPHFYADRRTCRCLWCSGISSRSR